MSNASWWRQAVTEDDDKTIDRPMLFVSFAVFVVLPLMLIPLIALSAVDVIVNKNGYSPASLGTGSAAMLAGVAAFVAAMVALLNQDRRVAPPSTVTTTTTATTKIEAPAEVPMQPGVEHLSPKIGPKDVGKSVAIVPPRKANARKAKK